MDCGDVNGLVQLLQLLNEQPELLVEAGIRAHHAFLDHYQRSIGVARIARILGNAPVIEEKPVRVAKAAGVSAG